MRLATLRWVVFTLLLILLPAYCFGQAAAINGQIEGTVTDPSGAAVPNVAITIVNTSTGYTRTLQTDDSGFYRFPVLPLGPYRITAQVAGFATARREIASLSAGATNTVDISLSLSATDVNVVVTDAAPVIDPGRTDVGSTLTTNQIVNLPLLSRNPYNFIVLQPNVSGRPNTEFGVPRKLNANGFNGRINYQLDGSNNTQSDRAGIRLIPISNVFVGEVQQENNGFAPEFGNTVGTVFNTITRSGTNDWHGEGGYIFRRTDFVAKPPLLSLAASKPPLNVDSFFGGLGGRIKKDKAFFYAAYEHVKRDLPQTVTATAANIAAVGLPASFADPIPFSQNVTFFFGRLDFQLSDKHRLAVRFNGHRNDSPYNSNSFGLGVLSRTYNFVDRSYVGAAQLISTLSPTVVNELRFQLPYRNQQQLAFAATGTGPTITIPGVILFGASPDVGVKIVEATPELSENISIERGRHSFKFGATARNIRDQQVQALTATYTFPSVAAYVAAVNGTAPLGYTSFAQSAGNPSIRYNSLFWNFYAQDNWKLRPNVTLLYGLRYDLYDVPNAIASSPYLPSRNFKVDKNNFAPRLGLSIGMGQDQRTVLRMSTGIYYDQPQTDVYRRALLGNGSPLFFSVNASPTQSFAPAFPNVFSSVPTGFSLPTQDITAVSPDFANLYSYNANVSISRQLSNSVGVTVTYLYTRGNRLPVYRNVNLVPNGQFLADGRPIFGAGRVNSQFNNIVVAESVGQSVYNGANVLLTKRLSRGFELFASYTLSHAIDDAPEQNNIDSGTAVLPEDASNRRRDRGNSLTDRRHATTASGVWQPFYNVNNSVGNYLLQNNRLAFSLTAYSGEVFSLTGNRILNGDNSVAASNQRPLFIGRNTIRAPRLIQLDVRYSRIFPITERWKPEFFAETTNILNRTNVTGLNTTATVDTLGNILAAPSYAWTSALDQRLIQFGIKVTF